MENQTLLFSLGLEGRPLPGFVQPLEISSNHWKLYFKCVKHRAMPISTSRDSISLKLVPATVHVLVFLLLVLGRGFAAASVATAEGTNSKH